MYWDVDGSGVVYYGMCCGDYRQTKGIEVTIEGEKDLKVQRQGGDR